MADATTTNRGYAYPNGKDLIPNGPAEIEALANDLDAENRGEIDYLQAGVTLSTDWSFTAAMESISECKLESVTMTGGICWLPLAAIGLVRSVTTAFKIQNLKPPSLPSTGKYMTVGFELTPSTSGDAATVSIVSGVEETTQKVAEEHVPATTAGKVRIRNIVVLNTAGVYSIVAQADVRPWCTGGTFAETKEEGKIGAGAVRYLEGTSAGRPAAAVKGRLYYATDIEAYYLDTGTQWNTISPSGWKVPVMSSALEVVSERYIIGVRLDNGLTVRLRGAMKIKVGNSLKSGETIGTLPEGYRPFLLVGLLLSNPALPIEITSSGVMKYAGIPTLGEGDVLGFDGLSFSIEP
jgi:hypothetical protein